MLTKQKLEEEIVRVETIVEDMDLNPQANLKEIKKVQNKISILKEELRGLHGNTFNF